MNEIQSKVQLKRAGRSYFADSLAGRVITSHLALYDKMDGTEKRIKGLIEKYTPRAETPIIRDSMMYAEMLADLQGLVKEATDERRDKENHIST